MAPSFQMLSHFPGNLEIILAICRAIHDVDGADAGGGGSFGRGSRFERQGGCDCERMDAGFSRVFFRGPRWFGGLGPEGWWCSQIRSSRHRKSWGTNTHYIWIEGEVMSFQAAHLRVVNIIPNIDRIAYIDMEYVVCIYIYTVYTHTQTSQCQKRI